MHWLPCKATPIGEQSGASESIRQPIQQCVAFLFLMACIHCAAKVLDKVLPKCHLPELVQSWDIFDHCLMLAHADTWPSDSHACFLTGLA